MWDEISFSFSSSNPNKILRFIINQKMNPKENNLSLVPLGAVLFYGSTTYAFIYLLSESLIVNLIRFVQRNKAFPWYNQKLITIFINFKAQRQQQQTQEWVDALAFTIKTAHLKVAADKAREGAMSQT